MENYDYDRKTGLENLVDELHSFDDYDNDYDNDNTGYGDPYLADNEVCILPLDIQF